MPSSTSSSEHPLWDLLARLLALVARPGGAGAGRRLFERAVGEAVGRSRERAFVLLALRGQALRWQDALAGLESRDPRLRATAIEFVDGSLPDRLRRLVVPLIDDIGAAEAVLRVGRRLDVRELDAPEAHAAAAAGPDRWLASCAFFAAAESGTRTSSVMLIIVTPRFDRLLFAPVVGTLDAALFGRPVAKTGKVVTGLRTPMWGRSRGRRARLCTTTPQIFV